MFEGYVRRVGEVDLMDGAVVRLRSSDAGAAEEVAEAELRPLGLSLDAPLVGKLLQSGSSETTDLYDGLSDIDDIYVADPAVEVTCSSMGIFEVDLGLDEPATFAAELGSCAPGGGGVDSTHERMRRPSLGSGGASALGMSR